MPVEEGVGEGQNPGKDAVPVAEEEPEVESKNLEKMPALSMSLSVLHGALEQMTQKLNLVGGGATGQIRRDVSSGCILADRLWNLKDLQKKQFGKSFTLQGHIPETQDDEDAADEDDQLDGEDLDYDGEDLDYDPLNIFGDMS